MSHSEKQETKALLLGVGLDGDGHTRLTKGKNFYLCGGSKDTHDFMVEKAVKLNEHLDKHQKRLEDVSGKEFHEIAQEIGLVKE